MPSSEEVDAYKNSEQFAHLLSHLNIQMDYFAANQHIIAKHLLDEGNVASLEDTAYLICCGYGLTNENEYSKKLMLLLKIIIFPKE